MTTTELPWRDAILSGFRLVIGRPAAALSWALVFVLGGTVMAGFQVWAWQALDAELGLSTVAARLGFSGVILGVLMTTVTCAAILRAAVRPDDRHAAWPRFGGDELRLLAFVPPLVLASAMIPAMIAALSYPLLAERVAYPVFVTCTTRVAAVALTLAGARLALAAPMTVADRRLRLGSALALSHGRHGRLAAILVAALLLSMAIEGAGSWICGALAEAMGGARPPVLKSASLPAALSAAFGPVAMAFRGLGAIFHALALAVQVAPMGYAYRRLKGDPIDPGAAFD